METHDEYVNLFIKNLFLFMKKNILFGIIECFEIIKIKYSKDFIFIGVLIGKNMNEWMDRCSKIK